MASVLNLTVSELPEATPEGAFLQLRNRVSRKRLGQFFTPAVIANLMAEWVTGHSPRTILDPSVGPGILSAACQTHGSSARLIGIDVDEAALSLAKQRLGPQMDAVHADFLTATFEDNVDAVICNPPYIRHHDFELESKCRHQIELASGQITSGLSNIYIYFILKACSLLAINGRAAILVPAEWSNANYGDSLKRFFAVTGMLREVVYFSGAELVFDDNLSTACVLLIQNDLCANNLVSTFYVEENSDISSLTALRNCPETKRQTLPLSTLVNSKKWDHLIANGHSLDRLGSIRLGSMVKSKRGIATGDNNYFMLSHSQIEKYGLEVADIKWCIGKTPKAKREIFTFTHAEAIASEGTAIFLFDPVAPVGSASAAYIERGVAAGVHMRYLTKMRKTWFSAEKRNPAPIWASVFGRERLRFVYNEARIHNLTTFHGIYPTNDSPIFARALTACLNSEPVLEDMKQQHRVYGGGLLKVEPRDLLDIRVPNLDAVCEATLEALSQTLDSNGASSSLARTTLVERALEEASAKPALLF
ncbi:MAG: N-6 DNA methylase [Pseudomonadota bacterium]